jgi:single-strand DNA-binding protein
MFQQITLVGNLGRDPEMRYTPSGVPVASFSVATSKRYQSQDGQWQDKTIWFRVTAWRKTAETVSQYLTKGSKVLIVGELEEPRTYVDKDGNTQVSLEVTAQTIRFLSSRGDTLGGGDFQREPARAQGNGNGGKARGFPEPMDEGPTDEDIPF